MIKNIINFIVVVSLLSTMSCKKKDENSSIILNENNMIVAQDQTNQMTLGLKKLMKPSEYPKIEIENSDFDFGDIIQGDKVSHVFKFKNSGKSDLVILDAHASCGCTVPDYPKTPIKVGESGKIHVWFTSAGKHGETSKTVTIICNTKEENKILKIKANIKVPKKG